MITYNDKDAEEDYISTKIAEKNFINLLQENKTYFLNGAWGSGKSKFIERVERGLVGKKVINIDLWNIKDNRTVMNIAFDNFYFIEAILFKILFIICVVISILMTSVVNIGIETFLKSHGFGIVVILSSIIALFIALWQFFSLKSDRLYIYIFSKKYKLKNKILVIDDFDRVDMDRQLETYKLFNLLKGKLPIVFIGDYSLISKNEKIICKRLLTEELNFHMC